MDYRTLLDKTNLLSTYPCGIKRQDLFTVTMNDDNESMPMRFIYLITHYNSKCRNVSNRKNYCLGLRARQLASTKNKTSNRSQFHPLDISTAVFLHCDPVARQDLVLHVWGCKHAFPLVVQAEKDKDPIFYLWSMRSIVEYIRDIDRNRYIEKPLIKSDLKVISILRFRRQEESKSFIFNKIISRSEKVHSFFYHHDCEGSVSKKSSICKGMIEAAPVYRDETGPAMYLNLRGNSQKFRRQQHFMSSVSHIMIVVCRKDNIEEIRQLAHSCYTGQICEVLILIFTDNDLDDKPSDLETLFKSLPIETEVILLRKIQSAELVNQISLKIDSVKSMIQFADICKTAMENNINVDGDITKETLEKAELISDKLLKEFIDRGKTDIFPAQGEHYMNWVNYDKEIYKLTKWNRVENVQAYRECLEKGKCECRRKQYKTCSINKCVQNFIYLNIDGISPESEIILRFLHLESENATRSKMTDVYSDFRVIFNDAQHNRIVLSRIAELEERMDRSAFSISDIVREMGQMYEAIESAGDETTLFLRKRPSVEEVFRRGMENIHSFHMRDLLPKAAAKLLLLGYPLELMNGRSNSVPICWIKKVFSELQIILGNVSVKIISVLGTQSTGKSTLLNIMFGSHFAVGPGRCTRGVNLQLVMASKEIKSVSFVDYFLIIDTEGLYSSCMLPDQIEERNNIEREIATFVIGISNITVVNIMGENISYLKDILPITVHAFLRMNLVGLQPKCRLLHHNVDRRNKMILIEQSQKLVSKLDSYTEAACKIEHENIRRFRDIIEFDNTKDIDFFPALYETDPIESINTAYSQGAMELKEKLIRDKSFFKLEEANHHIEILWNAVKTDKFVYEFRNIIETEVQSELDKCACRAQWNVRQQMNKAEHDFNLKLERCADAQQLDSLSCEYETHIESLITNNVHDLRQNLNSIKRPMLSGEAVQKLKHFSMQTFRSQMNEFKQKAIVVFEKSIKQKKVDIAALHDHHTIFSQMDIFLRKEMHVLKSNDSLKQKQLLMKWVKEVFLSQDCFPELEFEEHATIAIYKYFSMHRAIVDKFLSTRKIEQCSIALFLRSEDNCLKSSKENLKSLIEETSTSLNTIIKDIEAGDRFYQSDIFNDLILGVKNHLYEFRRKCLIKPSFEIELSLSLCGEMAVHLKRLKEEGKIFPLRFMKTVEQYFFSKCREMLGKQTSTDEAISNFSEVIIRAITKYIEEHISIYFAVILRKEYQFLQCKESLLCSVLKHLIEDEDKCSLEIYLRSPFVGVQCYVTTLFDKFAERPDASTKSKLHLCLEKLVNSTHKEYIEKLSQVIENRKECSATSQLGVMKQCTEAIISALESLDVEKIKMFEEDEIDEKDHKVVLNSLVTELKKRNVITKCFKSLKFEISGNQNEKIRIETVNALLDSVMGCLEQCPCCGEVCCNGQKGHSDRHRLIMHRPIGFLQILKRQTQHIPSASCWDKVEFSKERLETFHLATKWIIPVDVDIGTNSFWKYMFARHIRDFAAMQNIEDTIEIPHSWKTLTKVEEMRKLDKLIK